MVTIPGLDGVLFDLGNTLIPFTPKDSMEFVLKWYYSVPGLEEIVPFPDFLQVFRSVVIEERKRMLDSQWETNVKTRSSMIEDKLMEKGLSAKGISKPLQSTHTGAFTSCLRLGKNGRYVLDILSSYRGEDGSKIKLGLVSNAGDGAAIREFIERNDLGGYFQSVVISEEIGFAKPWKRIFEMALEEMEVTPQRAVYIGDRYKIDVLGAREAGLYSVYIRQYETAGEPPEDMEIDAVRIDHILDLPPLLESGALLK
jgi:putative hydrolase of the HAD superfamily